MNPPLTPAMFFTLLVLTKGDMHAYAINEAITRESHGSLIYSRASIKHVLERGVRYGWIEPYDSGGRTLYALRQPAAYAVIEAEAARLRHAAAAGQLALSRIRPAAGSADVASSLLH